MGLSIFVKTKRFERMVYKIIMIRHGESLWNKENRFCGWFDSDLREKGITEAHAGGKALKEAGYQFDVAHTSMLTRAQKTLATVLSEIGQSDLPVNNMAPQRTSLWWSD